MINKETIFEKIEHSFKKTRVFSFVVFLILYFLLVTGFLFGKKAYFEIPRLYGTLIIYITYFFLLYLMIRRKKKKISFSIEEKPGVNIDKIHDDLFLKIARSRFFDIVLISIVLIISFLLSRADLYPVYSKFDYFKLLILPFLCSSFYFYYYYSQSYLNQTFIFLRKNEKFKKLNFLAKFLIEVFKFDQNVNGIVVIKDGTTKHTVVVKRIIYIESDGKLKKFHIYPEGNDAKPVISTYDYSNFKAITKKLNNPLFVQISKSVMVNIIYIDSYTKNEIKLIHPINSRVKIGSKYWDEFDKVFKDLDNIRNLVFPARKGKPIK